MVDGEVGYELVTHKPDAEPASSARWYLKMHTLSTEILTAFERDYSLAAKTAFEKGWKRRLYVDLTAQRTSVSPTLLMQVASIITSNRKYTGKVYESVCILIPQQDSFLATAIRTVVTMIPGYNAPIIVFSSKKTALGYHLSDAKPPDGIQFI